MTDRKIDRNSQESIQTDYDFLNEIKEKLESHRDRPDVTVMEYALDMVTHWISELEDLIAPG